MAADLDKVFNPDSIAMIGASNVPSKWGSFLLINLLAGGYPRENIYPVNPKENEIHGLTAYPSIAALPVVPDLAFVTTPAVTVTGILEECAARGTRNIIVISSGFSEVGEDGVHLERELAETARRHDLNIVGPNTMGIVSTRRRIFAVGAPVQLHPGKISFVSQSGNVGANMLGWTMNQGIGFGKFVGSGNEALLHAEDYIDYFGADGDTGLILAYLEGVDNGRRFIDIVSRISVAKPVIVLKSGRTEEGGKAARSHTGSLAGSDHIYDAAFAQSGAIRAETSQDMLDLAKAFERLPLPRGDRLGIMTLGGGWGVLATDATAMAGLKLARLDDDVIRVCDELLPPFWSRANPIDLVGNIYMDTHLSILEAMARSPEVDAMIVLGSLGTGTIIGLNVLVSQKLIMEMSDDALKGFFTELKDRNISLLNRAKELMLTYNKPIIFVEMQFIGEESLRDLEAGETVIFTAPEKAAIILSRMLGYRRYLERKGAV
ncbi:MAG: CoA-binding protein [Actinomycetota bacterium]|nr:CoA-binding protein [Actinomycetota bacterium]MDD5667168.1 CoA-binding protein [Actinomycetota bacterium]